MGSAISGGVSANRLLRSSLTEWTADHEAILHLLDLEYSSDNAAMIAHAALLRHRLGKVDDLLAVAAASRFPLGDH